MKIDMKQGLLTSVQYLPSPHCDERPENTAIDLLVVHGISLPPAEFGGGYIEKFFTGNLDPSAHPYFASIADLKVAAHLLIHRSGQVTQFVPFSKRAWHAGVSSFQGRERCNDFSIGVELEGADDLPYEREQYQRLAQIIRLIQHSYPAITRDRIVGHSEIAPGRKTDPGQFFEWTYLDCLLKI